MTRDVRISAPMTQVLGLMTVFRPMVRHVEVAIPSETSGLHGYEPLEGLASVMMPDLNEVQSSA